jgi:CheY-like chemotaxis protein
MLYETGKLANQSRSVLMPDENSVIERRLKDLADERHETEESLRIITQIKKSEHENIPQKLGKGARILLVDDQSDTLEVLAATFESCGFDTVSCRSAAEALHAVDLGTFDLLISDIAMPLIDGLELIRSLRQRPDLRSVPAIALTGYASENDAQAAITAGFDLHLAKPVDPSELTTLVGDLLRSKSSGKT